MRRTEHEEQSEARHVSINEEVRSNSNHCMHLNINFDQVDDRYHHSFASATKAQETSHRPKSQEN